MKGCITGLRDGWVVAGWVEAPAGCERVGVAIEVDGQPAAWVTASAPLGPSEAGGGLRLGFEYAPRFDLVDGAERRIRALCQGEPVGEWTARLRHPRPYRDLDGLLDWTFHHRVICAPFDEVDRACLAQLDWEVDRALSASPAVDGAGPLVSVVMPTHDSAPSLGRAVDSVLAQRHRRLELLVVDDGSGDHSGEVLEARRDPRLAVIRLPRRSGAAAARNAALERARGDYVAYLDADNWWDERYLATMVAALERQPDREAAFGGQWLLRPAAERPFAVRLGPWNPTLVENENYVDINALVHRRRPDGGERFDEALGRLEDWDLLLRLAERGPPLFVPAVLSSYVMRPADPQRTEALERCWQEIVRKRRTRPGASAVEVTLPDGRVVTLEGRSEPGAPAPRAPRPVTVIIPSYEVPETLRLCLERLRAAPDSAAVPVIVCDGGSSPETVNALEALAAADPHLRLERSPENHGFTHAVNRGLALASPEHHLVLLNNDALVTPGWLDALLEVVAREPEAGIVAPQQLLFPGTHTIANHAPYANPGLEIDVNLSAHHANVLAHLGPRPGGLLELTFVPFFCVLLARPLVDRLGPLDAARGRHYRSDTLYCWAARRAAGLRILYTPRSRVYHLLQASTAALQRADPGGHAAMLLENTWRGVPGTAGAFPWEA
jgi:glycosyltransferase involved in cell wall biosynthesis